MSQWAGQVAVITGAGSGIGAGLARHAAALGMRVIAVDVCGEGLDELRREQAAQGRTLRGVRLDIRDAEAVEALAAEVFADEGRVNLLFNNAGVLVDGKSWERSIEAWRRSFEVNVLGVVNGIRSFVPRMLQQGAPGRVINTSSIGGLLGGGPFMGAYQSSKHAVTALTESLHHELNREAAPIAASLLCPPAVNTAIMAAEPPLEDRRSEEEARFHRQLAGKLAEGESPEAFAARVFEEIAAERFWIIPDTSHHPALTLRHEAIMARRNPVGPY